MSRNYRLLEHILDTAGSRCVAVGECGLDKSYKNKIPLVEQVETFTLQVKLALKHNKPIVLHIRDAEKEGLDTLQEVELPSDWPLHR